MQKITNIEIKNFKSIRHAEIKGCTRVNVFIGYPNVGKSNILEAIGLTSSSLSGTNKKIFLKDFCRYEDLIGLFNDGNKEKQIEIIIDDFVYKLQYFGNGSLLIDVIEKGLADSKENINHIASKRLSIELNGRFGQITTNSTRHQPEIDTKKYQFKGLQEDVKTNPLILDFPYGNNLFEVLRYNADLRKACGELFNDYELKLSFDENAKVKVQKQLDEFSVFQIPMSQVSDTLQRLIFHKAAIATNHNSVLLFEEPEAHMFPPYIRKLTTDILMDKNENQYFITTHSPYVLDELILDGGEDLSVYLVDYKNGETLIISLSNENLNEIREYGVDLFFNIENYLKHGQVNNS